jgi:membrane-bound metal-dependent hydrolase YbcI (DUF457 family)
MAGFKAHLTGGVISGASVSTLALFIRALTLTQAVAVFFVGIVAGLLPDLDSDTGKPLTLLFQLISVLIPSLLFFKATQYGGSTPEFLICYFIVSYLFINYVVCATIQKLTAHRGMMHSLPFAFLCAGFAYLLFMESGKEVALISSIAVFLGCLVHLVLDELHSFTFKYGFIPALKKSRGTALKLKSDSVLTTLIYYSLIVIVAAAIIYSS